MFKVQVLDNYPKSSLELFPKESYSVGHDIERPDAILVRSHKLHDHPIQDQLKAVGRAGTGIDNIPVDKMTAKGVPVFYAPGANANAVKELVLAAIIISSRNLSYVHEFISGLKNNIPGDLSQHIEQKKKQFVGEEMLGKTLGVIGLGNIGVKVANMAHVLGMNVIAYDPNISLINALALIPEVKQAHDMDEVLSNSDMVTIHIPLMEETKGLINKDKLNLMQTHAILFNFSRQAIINEADVLDYLDHNRIKAYVTDFASEELLKRNNAICFPHLGASTKQAQENASKIVINNLKNFMEHGNIEYSANMPTTYLPISDQFKGYRLVIINHNQPGVIAEISNAISKSNLNIEQMVNTSHQNIAVNLVDITGDEKELDHMIQDIRKSKNIINIRSIKF